MNKEIKRILVSFLFLALADGVVYNFQELWMIDNNMSTKTIGIVFSLSALLTVSTIFLCSNLINHKKLKKFTCLMIFMKAIVLLCMFALYQTGLNAIIKFLIMLDYIIDVEIYTCIYPLMSQIKKSDKLYARRGLIYNFAYYAGTLLTVLLLGKSISSFNIGFNTYCIIASILTFLSFTILHRTNLEKHIVASDKKFDRNIFTDILTKIKQDKITHNYLGFILFNNASYNSINSLLILILTQNIGFSAESASIFKLITGILTVIIATLILEKFTFKNNYVNISIKFIGRGILYFLAFMTNNKIIFLLAILFARITSEAYSHVTNAPYINRFNTEQQLAFCNLEEMLNYVSKSIGDLACGLALMLGLRYNFLFALIFIIFQIYFAFKGLSLRNKEKKNGV